MNHHDYFYPTPWGMPMQPHAPHQPDRWQQDFNLLLNAARTGAMIGGTGAAAMQLHRYQQDAISWQEAATGTLKGAFQAGVAASAALAVGRMTGNNAALSLAASLLTGTAVMYVLNKPQQEIGDE